MQVRIIYRNINEWGHAGNASVKGKAYINGQLNSSSGIATFIDKASCLDEFRASVNVLNGYWIAILKKKDQIFLASDQMRTIPLFYAIDGSQLLIADDARLIMRQIGEVPYERVSQEEYYLTGFVIGPYTLHPKIMQLQSGEIVELTKKDTDWEANRIKYSQYRHHDYLSASEEELMQLYDRILTSCFERLIKVVGNRQIAIPLSGGYDSRLIVFMLKKLGYTSVITFTYGVEGNEQSRVSKIIAKNAGYPSIFIQYSPIQWHAWIRSQEWGEFWAYADNLSVVPVLQDWPAIWHLKKQSLILKDAVIIPGHAADPFTGSRITQMPEICRSTFPTEDEFLNSIFRSHYCFWRWNAEHQRLKPIFSQRILESIGGLNTYLDWASAFDAFNENERQAKFIANALRSIEFWGYEWWLPYFDREFMGFWEHIPILFRLNRSLHKKYTDRLYREICPEGEEVSRLMTREEKLERSSSIRALRKIYSHMPRWLSTAMPVQAPLKLWKRITYSNYMSDQMGWSGVVNKDKYIKYSVEGGGNINALLSANFLQRISLD